jgi:hypothetical protein
MLIVYNDSPAVYSKQVRGIIGRYCWKIARDIWIWPQASIKTEIQEDLKQCKDTIRVIFVWKNNQCELGFELTVFGNMPSRQSIYDLFNHLSEN